jgi:uncharacterized metal-binding protein
MNQGYRYWNDDDRDVNDTIENYSREGLDESIDLTEHISVSSIAKKTKLEGLAVYIDYYKNENNKKEKVHDVINQSENIEPEDSKPKDDKVEEIEEMNENITHHTNKFATS